MYQLSAFDAAAILIVLIGFAVYFMGAVPVIGVPLIWCFLFGALICHIKARHSAVQGKVAA